MFPFLFPFSRGLPYFFPLVVLDKIYDFPVSYSVELKSVVTKYLKKWAGFIKSISNSVLYRSKDHFGL